MGLFDGMLDILWVVISSANDDEIFHSAGHIEMAITEDA